MLDCGLDQNNISQNWFWMLGWIPCRKNSGALIIRRKLGKFSWWNKQYVEAVLFMGSKTRKKLLDHQSSGKILESGFSAGSSSHFLVFNGQNQFYLQNYLIVLWCIKNYNLFLKFILILCIFLELQLFWIWLGWNSLFYSSHGSVWLGFVTKTVLITPIFWLSLSRACTVARPPLSFTLPHQGLGWEWASDWRGDTAGTAGPNQPKRYSTPYYTISIIKTGGEMGLVQIAVSWGLGDHQSTCERSSVPLNHFFFLFFSFLIFSVFLSFTY